MQWRNPQLIRFVAVAGCAVIILALFVAHQYLVLQKAHSTFEEYYAFRGCASLIARTDTYGICRLADGSQIKIVQYEGRWFLDGDLPGVW